MCQIICLLHDYHFGVRSCILSSDSFFFFFFNSLSPICLLVLNCASEQQPLRLNPVEVCEVIAAVCSETSSISSNHMTVSSKLRQSGRPSMDVAVSVLVKLVIDMYVLMHLLISSDSTITHASTQALSYLCVTGYFVYVCVGWILLRHEC